ncbi:hypothetical protein WAI453_000581 [Rhynchosporium graminicola]
MTLPLPLPTIVGSDRTGSDRIWSDLPFARKYEMGLAHNVIPIQSPSSQPANQPTTIPVAIAATAAEQPISSETFPCQPISDDPHSPPSPVWPARLTDSQTRSREPR